MNEFKPEEVKLRRNDRAVYDEAWIESFMTNAPICVVATAVDNRPFANTNTFIYDTDKKAIYFHTAKAGTLRTNIEANPQVCLTVFAMGRLLPADTAKELSVEYNSIVAYGRGSIVTNQGEMRFALEGLARKYFPHLEPGEDYRPLTPDEAAQTTVYRVDIERWSGKRKSADPEFPGAFRYSPQGSNDSTKPGS